jgi:hypothetical protein
MGAPAHFGKAKITAKIALLAKIHSAAVIAVRGTGAEINTAAGAGAGRVMVVFTQSVRVGQHRPDQWR